MYRIKTDIRQYKCDSVDKVEKLIRNWVIRPSDLIYLPETQRWSPIGDHDLFVRLFELLAEQERAEPETIVTDSPLEAQQANPEMPELLEEDPDEVTRIKERPTFEDSEPEEVPADNPKDEDKREDDDEETMIGRPVGSDTVEEAAQAPPDEPDDIEKPVRTEEVTVMTAKTLDMIITEDEPDPEEATQVTESPLAPEVQTPYEEIAQASEPDPSLSLRAPKIGRHDLPEEFFATNEISTPISREDVPPVDDLKELYGTHSVDDAWGELEPEEDLRITEQMDSPLDESNEEPAPDTADKSDGTDGATESDDDEWEEDEDEQVDASKIAAELLNKHASRIADVYNIPLPFEVGPSPEDEVAGLKRSKLTLTEKDRRFPYPSDKVIGETYTMEFDLSPPPPKDRTILFLAAALFVIVLAIIGAALM